MNAFFLRASRLLRSFIVIATSCNIASMAKRRCRRIHLSIISKRNIQSSYNINVDAKNIHKGASYRTNFSHIDGQIRDRLCLTIANPLIVWRYPIGVLPRFQSKRIDTVNRIPPDIGIRINPTGHPDRIRLHIAAESGIIVTIPVLP